MTLFVATLLIVHRPTGEDSCRRARLDPLRLGADLLGGARAVGHHCHCRRSGSASKRGRLAAELREKERGLRPHPPQAGGVDRRPVPSSLALPQEGRLSIGFYVDWDDNSYPALKRALPHLDWVIPSWLSSRRSGHGAEGRCR